MKFNLVASALILLSVTACSRLKEVYDANFVTKDGSPTGSPAPVGTVISDVSPASGGFVNGTNVSYTFSVAMASATITWTRTGGTADPGSPRIQALTGAELAAGPHTAITLTNNPALVDGAIYTLTWNATDATGIVAATVSSASVTFDTTADAAPGAPDLTAGTDLGTSSTDNFTANATPSFSVSCVTGSMVQLFDNLTATGAAVLCSGGTATVTAATLGSGVHATMNAKQTDPAGNLSPASGNLSITIDTTADAATGTPDMTSASDTGSSNTDNITSNATPSFTVSCVNGSSVQLFDNAAATGTPVICAAGTATLTAAALGAGVHASINAVQTDTAGNTSAASGNLSITIDVAADAAPGNPDLTFASDTGISNTDNLTNISTPSFTVACVNGSSVQLFDNLTPTGTPVTCAGGTATVTAGVLSGGTHTSMNATQTDVAGNVSPASGNLSVTIDGSADAAPGVPDMTAGTDLGPSNTDNITSTATPAFTVSCVNGSSVQLFDNLSATGTAVICASGTATLVAATLSGGVHASMNAQQTDPAGNISSASGNLSITIDTTADAAPGIPDLTAGTDSGPSSTDNITANATPSFTVSCVNGSSVQLYDNATPTGTPVTCAGGTATVTAASLTGGTHAAMNAVQTDVAGNASVASGNLSIEIDTTNPTVASGVSVPAYSTATSAAITFTAGTDTNITSSNVKMCTVNDCATGCVGLTTGTSPAAVSGLVNGSAYYGCVQSRDLAGNISAFVASASTVTVDTTIPVISAVSPATSATVPNTMVSFTFSEACASGNVTWTHTGGPADSNHNQSLVGSELNSGAHANITLTNNPTLVDTAIYSVSFNCTDAAGNVATTVTSTNVTYSQGPLTISSAETLDTNNNGKIDTYRLTFNKNVNDSTFPGYAANALGSVTTNWLIAGFSNVRLLHGTAVTFATDTANDAVIYLRFDENAQTCSAVTQVGCDTAAKPDLTTTATPGLQDFIPATLAQVNTIAVTEADSAKPVLIVAKSLGVTSVDAIFSETVDTTTAQTNTNYGIDNGLTVSSATRDGTNTNIVHLVTSSQTDGQAYVLTVNTNVKDAANNNVNSSANTGNFTGITKPIVVGIATASATTLTITYNESVTAASTECSGLSACALIYTNTSLPVLSAVSNSGAGINAAAFTLTVNPMIEGQAYTTTVLQNTVTSVATSFKMGSTNNTATFNGDGKPAPSISSDNATDCPANGPQRRVVVQYDQAVLTGGGANAADNPANYSIPALAASPPGCVDNVTQPCASGLSQAAAASVTTYGGNKFGINFATAFDSDASQYILKVINVRDANTNSVAVPTNLAFQCGSDTTAPSLIGVSVVSATGGSTVILLTFSEAVDSATGNTTTNYKYDSNAYGSNVSVAARQTNTTQVQVTFSPALANGGHQLLVQNVRDLASNPIQVNGINNAQPFIVNAPTGFSGGPVFDDPFADGTPAGQMVVYDNKIILGWDGNSSKFFELDKGLTTVQTLILDADGNAASAPNQFKNYVSASSGTLQGLDAINAGCVGGSATPFMTGSACSGAGGTEYMFASGFNLSGTYQSIFRTTDKSSNTAKFTFTELGGLDSSANTFRSMTSALFREYLYVASPHQGSNAPRMSRICARASGNCGNGQTPWGAPLALNGHFFPRIGKASNTLPNSTTDATIGNTVSVDAIWEYDNDGAGTNVSQLYIANGGRFFGALGGTRDTTNRVDGGVLRSRLPRSTAALPPGCASSGSDSIPDAATCTSTVWESVTPSNVNWGNYVSIPLPYLPIASADWANMLPANKIIPAIKAIPYMKTAPNGDLYMIRNACATTMMQTVCGNTGGGACTGGAGPNPSFMNNNFTANFSTTATGRRQVCPPGYEVPQLWVLPKNPVSGGTNYGAADWQLIASRTFTPQTYPNGSALPSRVSTTLSGNTGTCGTAPNNKCERNAHFTLLEFVGSYLYLGFDNQDHGANIWRVDMNSGTCTGAASCATSGNYPVEASFQVVNDVLGLDGSATNQRIFSHLTVNDAGKDWLIITTRDGSNSMKVYRTANDQN